MGKEAQEGRDIGIPMADSCWYLEETSTIVQSNSPSIKMNKLYYKTKKKTIWLWILGEINLPLKLGNWMSSYFYMQNFFFAIVWKKSQLFI